jgi:hypothetical protein
MRTQKETDSDTNTDSNAGPNTVTGIETEMYTSFMV